MRCSRETLRKMKLNTLPQLFFLVKQRGCTAVKQGLREQWSFEERLQYQRNLFVESTGAVWRKWADWLLTGERYDIIRDIGLNDIMFVDWYFERRRSDRPLPVDIDFFGVVFEFIYDQWLRSRTEMNRLAPSNLSRRLYKLGLNDAAIKRCVRTRTIDLTGRSVMQIALWVVYARMTDVQIRDSVFDGPQRVR